MKVVKCLNCKTVFAETDMTIPGHCPYCVCGNMLEEKSSTSEAWYDTDLLQLWRLFGDIPIDENDDIVEPFMDWPAGTYRFDIWQWFDKKYEGGVAALTCSAM